MNRRKTADRVTVKQEQARAALTRGPVPPDKPCGRHFGKDPGWWRKLNNKWGSDWMCVLCRAPNLDIYEVEYCKTGDKSHEETSGG